MTESAHEIKGSNSKVHPSFKVTVIVAMDVASWLEDSMKLPETQRKNWFLPQERTAEWHNKGRHSPCSAAYLYVW